MPARLLAILLLALLPGVSVTWADHARAYPHPTPIEVGEAMRACLNAEPMYVLRVSPADRELVDAVVITARGHFYLSYTGTGANWIQLTFPDAALVSRMTDGFVAQAESCFSQIDQAYWRR